jgi:hypothetical protein
MPLVRQSMPKTAELFRQQLQPDDDELVHLLMALVATRH